MKSKIPFSQLWVEEEQYLCQQSSLLGENSVIVEIGTAQGGSAYLFATSVEARNVSIYTYDLSPSNEALENLKGLDVHIVAKSSVMGAKEWPRKNKKPIDLLFIDGSHTLENVYLDFVSWFPYVKVGGKILFHDFDPIHRGGVAHLGVKVFVDALRQLHIFSDVQYVGRVFAGIKKDETHFGKLVEGCIYAWKNIGRKIVKFLEFDFKNCNFIGYEDDYLTVLRELRGFNGKRIEDLEEIAIENNVIILPHPLSKNIIERISAQNNVVLLDELIFVYLLYDSILNNRNKVLEITKNRGMYFKWEEVLEMNNHAHNFEGNIRDIFNIKYKSIKGISRACACELVRINILNNILLAINGKTL
jgi:hypothetical protein